MQKLAFQLEEWILLIDGLDKIEPHFLPEKMAKALDILDRIKAIVFTLKKNLELIKLSGSTLLEDYRVISQGVLASRLCNLYLDLCELELGKESYEHTKQSLQYYATARGFLRLSIVLLELIFSNNIYIDYKAVNALSNKYREFNAARKLIFFQGQRDSIHRLLFYQKKTKYKMLNWDLRLDIFFVARNTLNYQQLIARKITAPFFNEQEELIKLLIASYEILIHDLKEEFEARQSYFFVQKVNILLEEYKKFASYLRMTDSVLSIDKQIESWARTVSFLKKKGRN